MVVKMVRNDWKSLGKTLNEKDKKETACEVLKIISNKLKEGEVHKQEDILEIDFKDEKQSRFIVRFIEYWLKKIK
jgi:hypothetical protein